MVQLYIKHTDDNYYLLDLEENESINFKLTVKDLKDISKIYSPFTQTFKIKSTDKNRLLLGFFGNEKIQKSNIKSEFDSLLYISGFLFQSGILSPDEMEYEFGDQKTISSEFASNLTSLSDKLGDITIQELFQDAAGAFDPLVKTQWNKDVLKDRLQSIGNYTLANGINFRYGVPFISNNRVWNYNADDLGIIDNIAYKVLKTEADVNFVDLKECRPAINYMSVMNHLTKLIGTPIICPLFSTAELTDAFIWGSSESLVVPSAKAFSLKNYGSISLIKYDLLEQIENAPTVPKWAISQGGTTGIFKVKRAASFNTVYWESGFNLSIKFNGLTALESIGAKIKVVTKRASDNATLNTQEIISDTYTWRIEDPVGGPTMLDQNGELFLIFEVLPITLVSWTSITFTTEQNYRHNRKSGVGLGKRVTRVGYRTVVLNQTLSTQLGGNELNLISILPKMKCVDFLKSFFKTFNISVVSTGLNDRSMYWLTPDNIKEVNKPYSKRVVDYTQFVDVATLGKKKASRFNQYSFAHFASKYYESQLGDGSYFGSLNFPAVAPVKPTKFEVKTDYSIIKQSNTFIHPYGVRTCLGFSKEDPTVLENGANRYKPVYEELTIFYLQSKTLGVNPVSVQFSNTANAALYSILEASFKASNGKTFAFGAENVIDTDSLYLNYYREFIELLLGQNTYESDFVLTLPPNEIFLNFANLNQGESNIPTGFRAQNEVVIGEQRYLMIDATIDTTTGKTKITGLNF